MRLFSDDYSIRAIREDDLRMLLDWRNSERIRRVMLTDHEITWEEHYNWFKRNEYNKPPRNLIFEYKDRPIGYLGYTDFDAVNKICSPGCYLGVHDTLPADAGLTLSLVLIDYAFTVLGSELLKTKVFQYNKRTVRGNKLLGYNIIGEEKVEKDGKSEIVYVMTLHRNDWDFKKYI